MATLSHIADVSSRLPDDEMRVVALKIVDEVRSRLDRENQGLWTVNVISSWVQREATDPVVVRALQFFVARRDAQLLDVHYIYFAPDGRNPVGDVIDDGEVRDAYEMGFLVDPQTGDKISGFEKFLVPYFVPADGLTAS